MTPHLHLASASPRRAELLANLGLEFSAAGVDIDESRHDAERAESMVVRLACEKASAAVSQGVVLGADTLVVLGDSVFGKPEDEAHALDMLASLSGRTHQVMTGIAVMFDGQMLSALSVSDVSFRAISPDEARLYWQSGEPADKAGAYAIQGLAGVFVEKLSGSYSGVVGLPVFETVQLLRAAGIDVLARKGE